jgi:hypothetical protein
MRKPICALALAAACSDVRLDLPDDAFVPPTLDDQLTIQGDFCTSEAGDVAFPVKVMFIVDGSGSQQFSDQNRQRVVAVTNAINALAGSPNTYFKIIVFNASITAVPPANDPAQPVFTDVNGILPALTTLAEADTLTDYQGALAMGYSELLRDMLPSAGASPEEVRQKSAEVARTKYVVIFISDGMPDPQCRAGLGNDLDPLSPTGLRRICEDQDFLDCLLQAPGYDDTLCFAQPDAATLFGGLNSTELRAGNDYNQAYQILQKVSDIMELEERFDVGEIRVHAGIVLDPLADPAILSLFGDAAQAIPMMEQVAELGNGEFMQFYGGDSIDFLTLNFDAIKQPRVVRGFYGDNLNVTMSVDGLRTDSDGDGLTDGEELTIGTLRTTRDHDGDGYSDLLEYRLRGYGFDALDECLPAVNDLPNPNAVCAPGAPVNCMQNAAGYLDTDVDGLNDCEERRLGTDPSNPDSDQDGVPDALDFAAGLDPIRWDVDRDDDQDGIPNGREIEWHLNPVVGQNETAVRDRFRYDRPEVSRTIDGRPCYDFVLRRVTLMSTADTGRSVGDNAIQLYVTENLADDLSGTPLYRIACLHARYVPPSLKVPADGDVRLHEADFRFLPNAYQTVSLIDPYDPALDCLQSCDDDSVCPGGTACATDDNLCRQRCGSDADCPPPDAPEPDVRTPEYRCLDGFCR